jgi:uncharacterized membrane protein YqjE
MPEPTATPPPGSDDRSVAELVFDVSERASSLVREEIELAKTEVSEKVGSILRGSVVGLVAGTFAFLALILAMHGVAWLINDLFFDDAWPGYFIEAAVFLLIAAGAGFAAYRAVQAGAPPLPEQAIEEAKRTRAVLQGQPIEPAPNLEEK